MNPAPSTEARIWAILAHLSVLGYGIGIPLPIIGWADQRRKSNYGSFHCLQAFGYQSLGYTVWLLTSFLVVIPTMVIMLVTSDAGTGSDAQASMWLRTLVTINLLGFGVYSLPPVLGAVASALGRDFRYPILGGRLARYLGYERSSDPQKQDWLLEDREDRWVAAMGHFSVLIFFWGMLAPLVAWILQGRRSKFLRTQAVQTLIYQATATLFFLTVTISYLLLMLLIIWFLVGGPPGVLGSAPPFAPIGLVFLAVSFIVIAIALLLVPLFHILGQWAGYQTLKGHDYRYPVIGRMVEHWTQNEGSPSEPAG